MMKTNKKCYRQFWIIPLIGLFLLFGSCAKEDELVQPKDTLYADLQEALVTGMVKYKGGRGISAAIILPDGNIWVGVNGVSHGSTSISADMSFGAGSITKNFTAAAILKLAEENKLHLDDPLHQWLPPFPNVDSSITLRQLLNHTSGLNDIADNKEFWGEVFGNPSKIWDPDEMVRAFNLEPVFPKGTGWNYSSTGYVLLRIIIENIEETDIQNVYKERFFKPYGLEHTFTFTEGWLPNGTAHGWYDLNSDGDYDDFYGFPRTAFASAICGEVFSTAADLAKWAKALYLDKTVINQQSLDQMLDFHAPCTGEELLSAGYGLGAIKFNPEFFNGLEVIGHAGNAPGYAAASLHLVDYNLCIGIVDNTEEGNSMYVINDLIRIVVDHLEK